MRKLVNVTPMDRVQANPVPECQVARVSIRENEEARQRDTDGPGTSEPGPEVPG
jgi:hypothetical protein